MEITEKQTKRKQAIQVFAFSSLAFLIASVIMVLVFRKSDIHPFGDKQILVVDLWHQYYPFFRVLREKLTDGGSLFYSWQNGMGTNFLSLISYYAASPLNLLSVLFDENHVRDALTLFLVLKIGLSGAFFSYFLSYTFKRKDISITVFGILFALCSYTLGYYWNVMWFDTIALFPLVMTGVTAICREGKWKLFTISLALSLISNYYVGYFTCIFTIVAFAVMAICNCKGVKDTLYKLWIIARSSVLGIALGGFMLLPAYYGLQLTHSANNTFPQTTSFYEKWTDIFANLLSFSEPSSKEGLPNFACGMLAIVLFGMFILAPKIRIREKICAVLSLGFIVVSCNLNVLNYIWHGFHFTNMIPYRFAFIFSFILLTASFRAYDIILKNGLKIYQIIMMPICPAVIFWLNYRKDKTIFSAEMPDNIKYSLIITGVFILIFMFGKLASVNMKKAYAYIMSVLLLAGVSTETYFNAKLGAKKVSCTTYSAYPSNNEGIQQLLDEIEETENSLFYRVETTSTYTLNDSALYGYNGISQFSSSANVSITKFLKKLGLYGSEAGNRFMYRTSGPTTNALLGIKYVIGKSSAQQNDETYLVNAGVANNSRLYKNTMSLPIGYMMNSNILNIDMDLGNHNIPFEYQNAIFKLATGINKDIYTPQPVALSDTTGVYVSKTSYGHYSCSKEPGYDGTSYIYFDYTIPEDSMLFGYVSNHFEKVKVKQAELVIDSNVDVKKYPISFPMGSGDTGETVQLEITLNEEKPNVSATVMVYAMNKTTFEQMYEKLADEPFVVTEFSDTNIKGTVNALNDGLMYLSIPYEKGWSVYVDGEKQELVKVLDAMSGVQLSEGKHEIELKYIPEGFVTGSIATVIAILFFVAIAIFETKKRKNTVTEAVNSDSETPAETESVEAVVNETSENTVETAPNTAETSEKKEDNTEDEES